MNTHKQLATLILLLFSTFVHAANITVTASRNPVALDDSFHLVYEADSSVDDDPDFSPLYEHFDVLNSSQSTNMRMVNGDWSLKKSWDLTLIAKDVGRFTIPPIRFGRDISPAIQITVRNSSSPNSVSPDGSATIPAKIFLESRLEPAQGWVQSQYIFTIRLLRTVHIASASLSDPETNDPDAIIELLGEDQYQTTRNGIRYEVYERRYAIFPQKSGVLKVRPLTFEGRINAQQPRTLFDQFRLSGKLKRLRSRPVEATVKPAPAGIPLQHWLPATEVSLSEEWSADISDLKAGEPVTRTITLTARGLSAVQLPDIDSGEVDGLKQYPDKAVSENQKNSQGITGSKQFKIAMIPGKAGSYRLPAIELPWFNTRTGRKEVVRLPAVELKVKGPAMPDATVPRTPAVTQAGGSPVSDADKAAIARPAASAASGNDPAALHFWKGLSLFLAIAWLLTLLSALLFYRKSRRSDIVPKPDKSQRTASVRRAAGRVESSAGAGDARGARDALIDWARLYYQRDDISNLLDIEKLCPDSLRKELRRLNQALYRPEAGGWDGRKLLDAFRQTASRQAEYKQKREAGLQPLYR